MRHSMRYREYLHSSAWQIRRACKLEQAKHCCQICGDRERLSVHHLTYERLGCELSEDLLVVCNGCHWVVDEIRKDAGKGKALLERLLLPVKEKPKMNHAERRKEMKKRSRNRKRRKERGGKRE